MEKATLPPTAETQPLPRLPRPADWCSHARTLPCTAPNLARSTSSVFRRRALLDQLEVEPGRFALHLSRETGRVVEIHALLESNFVASATNPHAERLESAGELAQLRRGKTQCGADRLAGVNRSVGQDPKQRKSGRCPLRKSGKDRLEY